MTRQPQSGRTGAGTVYTCAHGDNLHSMTILDWQPFETFTMGDRVFDRVPVNSTYRVEPTGQGSRLTILTGRPQMKNPLMRLMIAMVAKTLPEPDKAGLDRKPAPAHGPGPGRRDQADFGAVEVDLEAIRKSIQAELAKTR